MAQRILHLATLVLVCCVSLTICQQGDVVVFTTTCGATSVNEGSSINVCALLTFINGSQALPSSISVLIITSNGTAGSGVNYNSTSVVKTFIAGSQQGQTVCVTIQTIYDMIVTSSLIFYVTLYSNTSGVVIGDRVQGASLLQVTINNIDVAPTAPPPINTVVFNASSINVNEYGSVQICATIISGAVSTATTVNAQVLQGTAKTPSDYSGAFTSYSIPANNINACKTITIVNDNIVEGIYEYFTVQLANSTYVLVPFNRGTTVVNIVDNDVVTFGFWSINPTSVVESLTSVSICVQMTNNVVLGIPVSIGLTVTGITATNGVDYSCPAAINITFWTGGAILSTNCTSISILQDNAVEDNEVIFLSLKSYFSYANISLTSANATLTLIEDSDSVTVGFSSSTFSATEGVDSVCQICVKLLAGALGKTVYASVTTSTLGTGKPYVDYIPLDQAQVVFKSGASAQLNSTSCINMTIIDDHALENNETVPLSLSSSSPVNTLLTSSTATVLLYDPLDYITLGFTGPVSVTEGSNSSVPICVQLLSGSLGRSVTVVAYTMNYTANPGVDYEATSVTLTFTSGQMTGDSQCFSIAIYRILIVKDTEFFSVNLTSTDSAVLIPPGYDSTIVTIYNDPENKITFGMRNVQYYCKETDSTVTVCVVLLSGQLGKNIDVNIITAGGTAIGNRDYIPLNTAITFNSMSLPGQSICTNISIINDNSVENSTEYFYVNLKSVDTVHTVIQIPQASVTITEDTDDVLIIGLLSTNYSGYEGYSTTICAIILNGTAERSVSVFASTSPISAQENVDYSSIQNMELIFPPGSVTNSTVCFNIDIINNTLIQADRTFSVTLQRTDPAVVLSSAMTMAIITIRQNSIDRVVIRMQDATLYAQEGVNTSAILCCLLESLSGNSLRNISGTYVVISSTAKEFQNYMVPTYTIMFPPDSVPGVSSWCVPIYIIDDGIVGNPEQIVFGLSSDDPVVYIDRKYQFTFVTIAEDARDYIEVQMVYTSLNVSEENSTVILCVAMTAGALEKNVTVILQTQSITAIDSTDYIGGAFTLIFTSGQSAASNSSQCVDIRILDDHRLEYDEVFRVVLNSSLQDADVVRISNTQNITLVTIIEDQDIDHVYIGMMEVYHRVVEGEQPFATLCAVLYQGELGRDLTVMLAIQNSSLGDTALPGRDYIVQSQMFTFTYDELNNMSSTPCVNVTILDDNIPENELYITIGLSVDSMDVNAVFIEPGRNVTTIVILDDDHGIAVGLNDHLIEVTEGVNFSINICGFIKSLTGIWKSNLSVLLVTMNSTEGNDACSVPNVTVLFAPWSDPGATSWCVQININDDNRVENSEQFVLQLVSNNPLVEVDGNYSTTIVIIAGDSDYIEVEMQYTLLSVTEESSSTTLCAMMTVGALGKSVSVVLQTFPITAIDGKDYIGGAFTLTFTSGQSAGGNNLQCINLTLLNDNQLEYDETLLVTLTSSPQDADVVRVSSTQNQSLITIVDVPTRDVVHVGMMQVYYSVVEGEQTFVTLCAVLYQGELGRNLSVMLTILNSSQGDTALPGRNYILPSLILTFSYDELNNYSSTPCVNVTIMDDHIPENELYLTLGLSVASNDSNSVIIVPGKNETTIVILDSDHVITVGFNNPLFQVTEGLNTSINVCGFLRSSTGIWKSNLTANIVATNGTAKDLEDYVIMNYTIPFSSWSVPGGTLWCFPLYILDDNILEDSQLLTLELVSNNPLVVVDGDYSTNIINITEEKDDYIEVQMQYASLSVSEESSSATLCAMMTVGVLGKSVSVVLRTFPITAIDGKDYIGGAFTLMFTSGQSAGGNNLQCINLTLLNDNELEYDETLLVTLTSSPQDAAVVRISSTQNLSLITIVDVPTRDVVHVGMMQVYYSVVEGEQTFVTLCAVLYHGELGRNLTVMLTVQNSSQGDTALPGRNYILQSQTLTFTYDELNNISSTPCVNVTILDDNIPENELYIIIGLSVASNDSSDVIIVPGRNQTTVGILDDDQGFYIRMQCNYYVVNEAMVSVVICVAIAHTSPAIRQNITFDITTNGTAKAGVDYTVPGTLKIDSTNANIGDIFCFNATIIDDHVVGSNLYFIISLSVQGFDKHTGVVPYNSTSEVMIIEDTIDYVNIGFEQAQYTVSDWINSSVKICIQLTYGSLERNAVVTASTDWTSNAAAVPGINYLPLLENITFMPNEATSLCINLTILIDHSNTETAVAVFLSTEDKAVHLTRNMTIIKIDSQSNVSVLLTPRGTVIIITIWIFLILLCCLLCIMCLLIVCRKRHNKRMHDNKVHPATTKHDLELIARHEIMAAHGIVKWRNDHFATSFPANGLKEQKDDGPEFGTELLTMCEKNSVFARLY